MRPTKMADVKKIVDVSYEITLGEAEFKDLAGVVNLIGDTELVGGPIKVSSDRVVRALRIAQAVVRKIEAKMVEANG